MNEPSPGAIRAAKILLKCVNEGLGCVEPKSLDGEIVITIAKIIDKEMVEEEK